MLKERHPTAQAHGEELKLRTLSLGRNEQFFKGAFVKSVAGGKVQGYDAIQLLLTQQQSFPDDITHEIAVGPQALEPEGQQLQICRRGERSGLSKARHSRSSP